MRCACGGNTFYSMYLWCFLVKVLLFEILAGLHVKSGEMRQHLQILYTGFICRQLTADNNSEKMTKNKPCVLCSSDDEVHDVPRLFVDVLNEYFNVVWMEDFQLSSGKQGDQIIAILNLHGKPTITENLLKQLPNLKIVAVIAAGYDHIDVKLVHSYGAKVSNAPHVADVAVADTAMALLLAAARNLYQDITLAMSPKTTFLPRNILSSQVSGTTLGIVGMGGIGFKVAERAKGFKMKVLYHNRNQRSQDDEAVVDATYFPNLNEMLSLSDYVLISVNLTEETLKLIGKEQFHLMKSSAILVNISRGATVDQDALVTALSTGQIRFAALDVTDPEPLPRDHPLLKLPNVIITPHNASATKKARLAMLQKAIDNVLAVLQGKHLPSEVF